MTTYIDTNVLLRHLMQCSWKLSWSSNSFGATESTALELLAEYATLNYVDCLLMAITRANQTHTVLTFDRELNRVMSAG